MAATGGLLERLQELRLRAHSIRIDVGTLLAQIGNSVRVAQNDHVIRQQPQIEYICVLKIDRFNNASVKEGAK